MPDESEQQIEQVAQIAQMLGEYSISTAEAVEALGAVGRAMRDSRAQQLGMSPDEYNGYWQSLSPDEQVLEASVGLGIPLFMISREAHNINQRKALKAFQDALFDAFCKPLIPVVEWLSKKLSQVKL